MGSALSAMGLAAIMPMQATTSNTKMWDDDIFSSVARELPRDSVLNRNVSA